MPPKALGVTPGLLPRRPRGRGVFCAQARRSTPALGAGEPTTVAVKYNPVSTMRAECDQPALEAEKKVPHPLCEIAGVTRVVCLGY
jgi:hypothetical protein